MFLADQHDPQAVVNLALDAKALLWRELEIEDLEDGAKAQTKKLSGLNKTIRWCPLYKDTSRAIKDFINTIPLITALRSKAMRPRHWDLLRKATGKEFTPPYEIGRASCRERV